MLVKEHSVWTVQFLSSAPPKIPFLTIRRANKTSILRVNPLVFGMEYTEREGP